MKNAMIFKPSDFNAIKAELKKRCSSVKYFNRDFYATFCDCYTAAGDADAENDLYIVDNIRLFHVWDPVYKSNFYQKNGCAYCEFLSIKESFITAG